MREYLSVANHLDRYSLDKIISTLAGLALVTIASTEANSQQAPHIEKGAVSFYSSEGTALAKKLAIPPPPIRILPIEAVDPSRQVIATKWQSPFCTTWDDGCTICERQSAESAPVCNEILDAKNRYKSEKCSLHAVKCRGERDIAKFCAVGGTNDELLLDGKSYKNMDSSFSIHWVYYYDRTNAKPSWQMEIAEEASLPTRRANEPADNWSRTTEDIDISCEEPQTDAAINPAP